MNLNVASIFLVGIGISKNLQRTGQLNRVSTINTPSVRSFFFSFFKKKMKEKIQKFKNSNLN